MGIPHFLAIPYPILGHMNPLLQFSQVLAKYGCKITFLSSDENYNRLKAASAGQGKLMESQIKLVSLPDGVDPQDDRSDQTKVILSTITTMRAKLPKLIQDINAMMEAAAMPWYCLDNSFFFQHMMQEMQNLNLGEWWLCNTTFDLEAGAFSTSPKLLPIGPLMMACDHNISSFLQEDRTCLEWLDLQPPQSVIYVSFGSMVSMKPNQFKELALGLDLLGKPFLWVVRTDNGKEVNNAYPDEFKGSQGKVVSWAPQKKILSHPALACFISHCGWNSTIEGVYNGVPFLCWPFCSDQLMNKAYICDVWKVGLGFDKAENGLISRGEIKKKVEQLLEDEEIKGRSLKLMEMVIKNKAEGDANLNKFINWAKE